MVELRLSSLGDTRPHQYLVRFLFGGAATVAAGLIARRYGPAAGGLFLAFPAIFPAGVTLIESHEKERKAEAGHDGTKRGRMVASLDAAGATLGAIGLIGFALVLWHMLPSQSPWLIVPLATMVWCGVAFSLWELRKRWRFGRHQPRADSKHSPAHHT